MCKCVCDCGNTCIKAAEYLKVAAHPSCGCMTAKYRAEGNQTNEIGRTFGRLTIIDILRDSNPAKAVCECECGAVVVTSKANVVSEHTLSCGCLRRDRVSIANTADLSGICA